MLSKSFKPGKCKTTLKLATARIRLLKNKRVVQVKQLRREVAQLLEAGQDQTARIRVEHVIREEKTMSAYDLIELYCELIVARLAIIESQKTCPIDLKEAISSVIFASPRCADIPELLDIRKHFTAKYGKEFVSSALELRPECGVNRMIVEKLSASAPNIETKTKVLTAIAQEHNVKWDPTAFEEQGQKAPEDLLHGPTTFASASKTPMDSSNVQFPPPSQKHEPATKSSEQDVVSSSASSDSFSSRTKAPTTSWTEPRARESRYEGGEFRQSYVGKEDASSNGHRWGMEFKDATSAAQAAAESAERASFAARAAAEIASRANDPPHSSGSHEPSVYYARHEEHGNPMGSRLKAESVSRDSVKMDRDGLESADAMKLKKQNQQRNEDRHKHMVGVSERENDGSSSAKSGRPFYDELSDATFQSTDAFARRSPSKEDVIYQNQQRDQSFGGGIAIEHFTGSASSHSDNSSSDNDVFVNVYDPDGYAQNSFSKVKSSNQNFEDEKTKAAGARQGNMERKPIKFATSSSSRNDLENCAIWDSPKNEEDVDVHSAVGVGQEFEQSGLSQHSYNEDSPAVFDDFGSESPDADGHLGFGNYDKDYEHDPYLSHQGSKSYTSSSNRDPLDNDKQHGSGLHVKNSLQSHSTSLHPEAFSDLTREEALPSNLDAVTYDVSDGGSSESEDEMENFRCREGIQSSSSRHENNSIGRRASLQTGSESRQSFPHSKEDKVIDETSRSYISSDDHGKNKEAEPYVTGEPDMTSGYSDVLDDQDVQRRRNPLRNMRHLTGSGSFNSQLDEDQQAQGSRKPSMKVEAKTVDKVGPSRHSSTTDSESKLSYESGHELNFGRLRGGLRNKGFLHPSYARNPLGSEAHASEKLADDSPPFNDIPAISHPDKTLENLDAESRELQKQKLSIKDHKGSTSTPPVCASDPNRLENELQAHRALGSRGYIRDVSHPSTTYDTDTLDEKQQISFRRASKESSQAKMTAHLDTDSDKQAPYSIKSRHLRSGVDSISSNKEPDDSLSMPEKPTISKLYKISESSVPHEQKKQAKADKESMSGTAIPYFDEENEEEVIQPRYTFRNSGDRAGRLSQRTRDWPAKNKVGEFSKFTGQSDFSGASDLRSPSFLSSSMPKPLEPTAQAISPEKKESSKFLPPKAYVEQHSLPPKETDSSAKMEHLKSSQDSPQPAITENTKSSTSSLDSTRESSFKRSSHVHPNLPDYDSLAAHFKSLRSNKR